MKNRIRSLAILFVDDEDKARKYFKKAYEKDFRVLLAASVAEARLILDEMHDEIGLVITDQRMPSENGIILLKLIKQNYPQILRILTTAYSDLEEAIEAVNAGEIMRYIQKPWDLRILKGELTYAIRHAHVLRERDQLYVEKLSVRQRLIAINRVRDLVVMAGSFNHLRSPLAAMQSFLLQQPFIGDEAADNTSLDMWALMEHEIEIMLALSSKITCLTQGATEMFEEVSLASLLEGMKKGVQGVNMKVYEFDSSLPSMSVEPALIQRALQLIIKEVASFSHNKSTVNVNINGNGNVITLSFTAENPRVSQIDAFKLSAELLSVFFIIYHHSGDVRLADGGEHGFEIVLPTDPNKVKLAPPPAYWLNDVLSSFEA